MPELDLPKMLAGMVGAAGTPAVGWVVHFIIGVVVYGMAMALIGASMPGGSSTAHGITLGVIGWLIMMLVLMPMVGAGVFAMNMGVMAPVMTLMLHLIFGAVLGWTYGRLVRA